MLSYMKDLIREEGLKMKCEKCGKEYESEKCPDCQKSSAKKVRKTIAAIIGIILILVLISVLYKLSLTDDNKKDDGNVSSAAFEVTSNAKEIQNSSQQADNSKENKTSDNTGNTSDNSSVETNESKTSGNKASQSTNNNKTETSSNPLEEVPDKASGERITLAEYNSLKAGMSYEEVVKIIGSEGVLLSDTGNPGEEYYTAIYLWYGTDFEGDEGSVATVTFQNGKMLSGVQTGLQ